MKELKFKTNINCGGCVAKVTPFLDDNENIDSWVVDTQSPDKILPVIMENASAQDLADAVKKAGFTIEPVQ